MAQLTRRFRGRMSQRERVQMVRDGLNHWSVMSGKPIPEGLAPELPPMRERVRRPIDGKPVVPLEKDIQKTILAALKLDKRVVFVGRFNRGQAVATDAYGGTRYTPFNSVPGFPDIHGLLIGGRAFYIEVKRPPPFYEKPKPDQRAFIDAAKAGGAAAGVATSVEEAIALLA